MEFSSEDLLGSSLRTLSCASSSHDMRYSALSANFLWDLMSSSVCWMCLDKVCLRVSNLCKDKCANRKNEVLVNQVNQVNL